MRALAKRFLDQELSRRDFARGMAALGFSGAAVQSVLSSMAYAGTSVPRCGSIRLEFHGVCRHIRASRGYRV